MEQQKNYIKLEEAFMTNLAIVQARLNSSRFPNKTIKKVHGKCLIEILLFRLSKSKEIEGGDFETFIGKPEPKVSKPENILAGSVIAKSQVIYFGEEISF